MCKRLDSSEILTDFWTILDLHESLPFPIPFPLKMTFTFCHGFLLINSEPPLLRCRMVLLHTPGSYDAVYLHFFKYKLHCMDSEQCSENWTELYGLFFIQLCVILMKAYSAGQCIHVLCLYSIEIHCLAKKSCHLAIEWLGYSIYIQCVFSSLMVQIYSKMTVPGFIRLKL